MSDIIMVDTLFDFKDEERVLCFHGPLLYEAKILKSQYWDMSSSLQHTSHGPHYLVHYQGWKSKWDEWVPESRVRKYNDENLAEASELKEFHNKNKRAVKEEKKDKRSQSSTPKEESSRIKSKTLLSDSDFAMSSSKKNKKKGIKGEDMPPSDTIETWIHAKPTVEVEFSALLQEQLIDDWEWITKQSRLVALPRYPTVRDIVYNIRRDPLTEGFCDYFDKALGKILLYRFERQQYLNITRTYPNLLISDIYGAEHLLRFLVKIPYLLADNQDVSINQDILKLCQQVSQSLDKRTTEVFMKEYDNAPSQYISLNKWL